MGFMEKGTTMVAAIAVCAILILSVLVPVIADNGGTVEKKIDIQNEGTPLIQGDVSGDYKIQWDSALPGMVKINPKEVTVTFSPGKDATVSPTSKTVAAGLTYGELPVPTKTGYTFDGWYTSTSYTTEVTEDTIVGNSNVILYAKWIANTYTVTFNADGGTVNPATKTVTFGSAYGELPVPEYTGYNFGGWFDENDSPITSTTVVSIADDHTLTARWTAEQYLISFTTDGNGTVDVASLTADYGTAYTISGNTVTIGTTVITATPADMYVFDHWTPSTSGTISGATVFTANFNLPPVTISFAAQSPGSVDTAQITDVPRGTQYTVLDNTVVLNTTPTETVTASLPTGYYMIGWDVAQGVGTITDAMTFTARYEVIEIAKVVTSNNSTWIITTDGKLYGCGNNSNGNQGDGTTTDVKTFTQRLTNETIADVVCSDSTTWVITTDSKLFGCGNTVFGQQGDGTYSQSPITSFTQRLSTETIAKVVCSNATTWALTTDGKLFGCGKGTNGQQGDGPNNARSFIQRLSTETIADVVCSTDTTWAITTDGKLFGCGNNNKGQQGNGTSGSGTEVTTFTQRLSTETVAKVVCSDNATWVVTTDGKLFGCGDNIYAQQGDGTTINVTSFTQRLDTETIANVSMNNYSTWALTTDGKLFGCGSSYGGAQGSGATNNVTTFTQRLNDKTITIVNSGTDGTTTWAITTDGKLFGCGNNSGYQQGSGNTTNITTFTQRLTTETIANVSVNTNTTWALTTDGKIFSTGANSNGQQGDGTTTAATTFTQRGPPGSVYIKVVATFSAQSPGSVDTAQINVPVGTQYTVLDNTVTFEGIGTVTASLPDGYYMTGWNVAQGTGTITDDMTFTASYEMIEIADVVCSNDTTWIITTDGKLFGCGSNQYGQQGDGTTTDVTTFTQRLDTETIAKVVCTQSTTWVITTDGKLYGCGYNNRAQQGDGTTTDVTTFTQRLSNETIADVVCSTNATWVLTTDGKLYGCGRNAVGQQGDGTTTDVTTFTQRLSNETIAKVVCSEYTTWAITTDGELYGCGYSNHGQQGSNATGDVTTFTQRLSNETIADVVCSNCTTWALTTDGKLYGCGYNNYGQQGDGTTTDVKTFTQRLDTETIAKVLTYTMNGTASETNTTWAITTDGKLFGCGYGSNGQQGSGLTSIVKSFTQRLDTETIADVVCSNNTTWALTTDGKLYGCGFNFTGQQGDGTTTDVKTFTQRLDTETIADVVCSNNTTWVITDDGKLFGCGKNNYGQQGNGTTTDVTTFTQCGPGTVNISVVIQPLNVPLNVPLNNPHFSPAPMLLLNSVSPANIVGTDYTFHAGGTGWLLCTVSVGQDQYALALFSSDLQSPLLWDEDVALMFSNGTMTVENGDSTYTMTYTDIYFEGNGEYILTTGTANVLNDTQLIGFSIPSPGDAVQVTGVLGNLTAAMLGGSSTVGTVTATAEDTDYDEVKNITAISFEYNSDSAVCSSLIAPKKVTVTETVENETMKAILSMVPLVMIVGLMLAVAGTVLYKRL